MVLTRPWGRGLEAVLQVRGEFNPEKMGPESWPGGCQVTVHGRVREDENLEDALQREAFEELGRAALILALSKPVEIYRFENRGKLVVTYALYLKDEQADVFLRHLQLNASSGGIKLVRRDDLPAIKNLQGFKKDEGVRDRSAIAMFPDELEALKLAFAKFFPG